MAGPTTSVLLRRPLPERGLEVIADALLCAGQSVRERGDALHVETQRGGVIEVTYWCPPAEQSTGQAQVMEARTGWRPEAEVFLNASLRGVDAELADLAAVLADAFGGLIELSIGAAPIHLESAPLQELRRWLDAAPGRAFEVRWEDVDPSIPDDLLEREDVYHVVDSTMLRHLMAAGYRMPN